MKLIRSNIKNIVKEALTNHPPLRDDDNELYIYVIEQLVPDAANYSGTELIRVAYKNYGVYFETVRRTRQLLQEKYESLRGEKYEERHRKRYEVRNELVGNGDSI